MYKYFFDLPKKIMFFCFFSLRIKFSGSKSNLPILLRDWQECDEFMNFWENFISWFRHR